MKNFTDEDVEAYKYAFSQSGLSGPLNYYRNIFTNDLPRGYSRSKIKAPTLVVWVSVPLLLIIVLTVLTLIG